MQDDGLLKANVGMRASSNAPAIVALQWEASTHNSTDNSPGSLLMQRKHGHFLLQLLPSHRFAHIEYLMAETSVR